MIIFFKYFFFDQWIGKKKELNFKNGALNFKEREIFWCALGHNIGDMDQSAMITYLRLFDSKRLYNKLGQLNLSDFIRIKDSIKNCL